MTTTEAHRRHEQAELREQWIAQNPSPPLYATRAQFEQWHQRWLASEEYRLCVEIAQGWLFSAVHTLDTAKTRF